ncbi:GNAT family N-acetyltransferase [Gephyromycinifex aptenodytis]|uniref:GNAT family N-acetyltransferase n=1 Tax=Gephyromycinifex aptenodytis TaxID=2716227 RepID=UPI001447237E|nr:GNAT family N-acetyltransferase [Gephyromycinifex aptenodytis]
MNRFEATLVHGSDFLLRPPDLNDVEAITIACQDDQAMRWLPIPRPYTQDDARAFIQDYAVRQLEAGTGIVFALASESVQSPGDSNFAGLMDLKHTDWSTGCTEIGYWTAPWARGAGLTARAARRLAEWAIYEKGLDRVQLCAALGNDASAGVARRAGFVAEGIARSSGVTAGGRVDMQVFSLISADLP